MVSQLNVPESLTSLFLKNKAFTVDEVASLLGFSSQKTSEILAKYIKKGDIKRIKRGHYIPIQERFLSPEESISDPWKLVPVLFSKGYIGGWSASNFWQLTDQIFHDTSLMLVDNVPYKTVVKDGFKYRVFTAHNFLGCETVIRDNTEILISDPHKTILDMINNPTCGAGILHVLDCFDVYTKEHLDEQILLSYAKNYDKGTFYKRLGFISEQFFGSAHPLCDLAKKNITKGYSKIDPTLDCPKLITRWNLFINESLIK